MGRPTIALLVTDVDNTLFDWVSSKAACTPHPCLRGPADARPAHAAHDRGGSGRPLERVLYVGDNLWKDVAMAQRAGVHAAWARYGTMRTPEAIATLTRLCHWTAADEVTERAASTEDHPAVILERGLRDIFECFDFISHA